MGNAITPLVLRIGDPRWAAFVAGCPEATSFHHPEWARMLADCFDFPCFVVAARGSEGSILAGLPVMEVRGLRARRWISLPFTDACAPLGELAHVPLLIDAAEGLFRAGGITGGEIRAPLDGHENRLIRRGVVHSLRLESDPEAVFERFDRSHVQRGIRKADRDGVVVRVGTSPRDLLEVFYGLHLLTRRRLGVPIQPRTFFELLWERLLEPGLGYVLVAERNGAPEAAAVFLASKRTLLYKYGASDPGRRSSRPNHAIFWEAIRRGCAAGNEFLDFGRTDLENQGLRVFKSRWGAEESDLLYTAVGVGASVHPGRVDGPVSTVIRRSPPWVCRFLGERLYRYAA